MRNAYDRRIARAHELATKFPESTSHLEFYGSLARFQKPILENLDSTDVRDLLRYFPALIELVERAGPDPLKAFARARLDSPVTQEDLAVRYWDGVGRHGVSAEEQFFARVLLQPYAEYLAARGSIEAQGAGSVCPFCCSKAVAAVLRGEGEGAKRSLSCSLCATEWLFRRVLCPNCGEEHKDNLPVYTASEIPHVRVEACDTCRRYIKSVDLTKDGLAVPVVDEMATIALDIWANEHGYSTLETNLLGM